MQRGYDLYLSVVTSRQLRREKISLSFRSKKRYPYPLSAVEANETDNHRSGSALKFPNLLQWNHMR